MEICKYLIVGGINTLFTTLLYLLLLKSAIDYRLAILIAWFVGILFTYTFNYIWVFKPEVSFSFARRFWRYLLSYSLSLGLNLTGLNLLVETWGVDPFYAQLVTLPFIVTFNYLMTKFWSLRRWTTPANADLE